MTVSVDVCTLLESSLGVGYSYAAGTGDNIFHGPESPPDDNPSTGIPHKAIFVVQYGGTTTIDHKDGTEIRSVNVQILVRSDVDDWDQGEALAALVREAIDKHPPNGYIEAVAEEPRPFGKDPTGHFKWIVNASLRYQVAS